jgi:seryl-tRNA synthetase
MACEIVNMMRRRGKALAEAESIVNAALAEVRGLKPEEDERIEALKAEVKELAAKITTAEAEERRLAATAVPVSL